MAKPDLVVVGSGLSGAVVADLAKKRGLKVTVLERRHHIGGNVYTEKRHGIKVHVYGAHIFHTKNKEAWQWMCERAEMLHYSHQVKAYNSSMDRWFTLPFGLQTLHEITEGAVSAPQQAAAYMECLTAQQESLDTFEGWCKAQVGDALFEALVRHYTEKQWGKPCSELPPDIVKRLPVHHLWHTGYFTDPYQGMPADGYTPIIEQCLDGCEVVPDYDYLQHRLPWCNIPTVFTGAIDEYFGYRFGALEWRSLHFEHAHYKGTANYQGCAVVNYTGPREAYTRKIEHRHFDAACTSNDTIVTTEYPELWEPGKEAYYPIRDAKNLDLLKKYQSLAANEKNVLFLGRLAQYVYIDMHQAITAALTTGSKWLSTFPAPSG